MDAWMIEKSGGEVSVCDNLWTPVEGKPLEKNQILFKAEAFLSVSLLKRLPYIASHVDHSVLFENISSYAEEGEIKRKDL